MVQAVFADGRRPEPDPPGEDPWAFTPLVPRVVNDTTVLIDIEMTVLGRYIQPIPSRHFRSLTPDTPATQWQTPRDKIRSR